MNKVFADHVTTTAFFLSVSKKQIRYLKVLFHSPFPSRDYYLRDFAGTREDPDNWLSSYRALERKGLVTYVIDDIVGPKGHWELTSAGSLTCQLLIEAGLMEELEEREVV